MLSKCLLTLAETCGSLHLNHFGVGFAQGQLIASDSHFHGIAQRGNLSDGNGDALGNAHVHNSALDSALAVELDNGHGVTNFGLFQCLDWGTS